jgi:hypothetical protein
LSQTAKVFDFESDFAGSLRCIPMAVRLKLDLCGVKVSLRQWNRFMRDERDLLLKQPCDTPASTDVYRDYVAGVIESRTGEKATLLPVEVHPDWSDDSRVPAQVSDYFALKSLPPLSAAQWSGLEPVQRFVLVKLTRPGHHNDNFLPALREFGLLSR